MKEITVDAAIENIGKVTLFAEEQLKAMGCPVKSGMQISMAIDELFSNIAKYAYHKERGQVTVRVECSRDTPAVVLTFIDAGIPYNPLEEREPDVTLPAGEREPGGLGIYLVKKSMDELAYEYKDGQNILCVRKYL